MKYVRKGINLLLLSAIVAAGVLGVAYAVSGVWLSNRNIDNGSMRPTIPVGAKVFLREQKSYRPGDVLTFRAVQKSDQKSVVVTHRLLRLQPNGEFITKGDYNQDRDYPALPVTQKDVIGKVVWSVPVAGGIQMWMQTHLLTTLGCLLILVAFFTLTLDRKRPERTGAKTADEAVSSPA